MFEHFDDEEDKDGVDVNEYALNYKKCDGIKCILSLLPRKMGLGYSHIMKRNVDDNQIISRCCSV